ncbi:MAG: hypothetical protein ABS949_09820 [Solibacillus sp.]
MIFEINVSPLRLRSYANTTRFEQYVEILKTDWREQQKRAVLAQAHEHYIQRYEPRQGQVRKSG